MANEAYHDSGLSKGHAAILIPCLMLGGTEVASLLLATSLKSVGYDVDLIVYFSEVDSRMLNDFRDAGIHVILLENLRQQGSLRFAIVLRRVLANKGYSLIWVQYMTPTLIPLLIARFFTGRLVAMVHVAASHYSPFGLRRIRFLARWWCNRFVCVSQTTARGIFGSFDTSSPWANRVTVLPNALDLGLVALTQARDWRRDLCLPAGARIGGYVGRLAHNKGVDILVRAAAILKPAHPELHWVIVGDGPDRGPLEALATKLGVASVIHFIGDVTRCGALAAFKGFDVAVVPSREEGFGLSALEAMACGVPLVASAVGALHEVVIDGVTGLLVAPEDSEAMVGALNAVLADSTLACRLRDHGLRHVAAHYGQESYHARLHMVLPS
jgi:glycosyltransferase involved in cell wall biosynthesis